MIADAHLDLLLELHHREHRAGETGVFARTWLPLLEAGGVGVQVCPIYVGVEHQPESTLREALGQAASFHAAARENADRVTAVRSAADLDAVVRGGRLGLVLALEGVEPLGYDAWPAEVFWELGLRMASLTWNRRNPFADGVADTGGLSRAGRALVDRLCELGVALDLAHASPETFSDVLARSGDAPVLVSHAGCRALNDHPRNLADDQLRALAERDGVFGVMLHPLAIGHDRATITRVAEHVEHAVATMGIAHVCLGGDFVHRLERVLPSTPARADGLMPPDLEPGSAIEGLSGPDEYPALLAALRDRGWSDGQVEAVAAGNLLRFLRRALPG